VSTEELSNNNAPKGMQRFRGHRRCCGSES